MPKNFAQSLAQQLAIHHIQEPFEVDLPNHGFHEEVARELERLGHRVEKKIGRPTHLIIYPKGE